MCVGRHITSDSIPAREITLVSLVRCRSWLCHGVLHFKLLHPCSARSHRSRSSPRPQESPTAFRLDTFNCHPRAQPGNVDPRCPLVVRHVRWHYWANLEQERIDALDTASNATVAIGIGFCVVSAVLGNLCVGADRGVASSSRGCQRACFGKPRCHTCLQRS